MKRTAKPVVRPRIINLKETTYVFKDLANSSKDGIDFEQKNAQKFIQSLRRKNALQKINRTAGCILHLDPLCAVVVGEFQHVNQSMCLPLAPEVTEVKGFETMTFPETKVIELPLGRKNIAKDFSRLLLEATLWANKNGFRLGNFWRLHNRANTKGQLRRFAQIELACAN